MTETKETAAERAIREALESVERIERDGKKSAATAKKTVDATDEEADLVQILDAPEGPPSASNGDGDAPAAAAKPAKKSASDALLEATIKAKQEMAEVLAQTQKEAKDMFDRLARVSADFENFKKRVQREKADAIKFGNESLIKEMLPVVDNMNRAVASLTSAAADTATTSDDKLLEGIKLVAKQFEDALAKVGVTGFAALGQPFDPARHEAVGARPDDKIAAQHVCEEYQRGYMLHDRLLRPALVIVSAGPSSTTASSSGEPATEN